jgi:hypothetical protein
VLLRPVVAESATVFTVPVVRPTPLFRVPVAALDAWPIAPGFFAGAAAGVDFLAAMGVGFVPSGLEEAMDLGGTFLIGVAFVPDDAVLAGILAGVLVFAVVTGLLAGVEALGVETGSGFLVPMGVRTGFGASPTEDLVAETGVFFTGVARDPVSAFLTGRGFTVPSGVRGLAGVDAVFAGVDTVFAGVDDAVEFNFAGAFFAGVEAAGVACLTGVAAFDVVLVALAAGFFAVCCAPEATFCKFPTLD